MEAGGSIDLRRLAASCSRLNAAAGRALVATAGDIDCRHWGARPWDYDRATNGQPISNLPAGFSALELHAPCVTIVHYDVIRGLPFSPLSAALTLCMIFKDAPSSYQRFSLCWMDQLPLTVQLAGAAQAEESSDGRVLQLASTVLADNLRESAVYLDRSVTMVRAAGMDRIDVARL